MKQLKLLMTLLAAGLHGGPIASGRPGPAPRRRRFVSIPAPRLVRMAAVVGLLLALALPASSSAEPAGFTVTGYVFGTENAAIPGYTVEDFEDVNLINGLTVNFSGGITPQSYSGTLNQVFNPSDGSGVGAGAIYPNNTWDGLYALTNGGHGEGQTGKCPGNGQCWDFDFADTTEFSFATPVQSVGIGLSNFQSLSTPKFSLTDHELLINGLSLGLVESIAGWQPGIDVHNLYVVITATGSALISSVAIKNISRQDGLVFDKLAVLAVNVAPSVGAISATPSLVALGSPVSTSANFTDPDTGDTHIALWDWGDSSESAGTVTEAGGSGTASDSHTYAATGVYTVQVTVTDDDDASDTAIFEFVVVYDPSGGFVTGGGWINSPAGAYEPDPSLTGKANFGFVSKYKKGATVPTGKTEFRFKAGDLNFHSSDYDWLVIAGANAKFKGTGTINGAGNFGFMLTATDGQVNGGVGVDTFRIKIWDKDNSDAVVYDNQPGKTDDSDAGTELGGGSIKVHKG